MKMQMRQTYQQDLFQKSPTIKKRLIFFASQHGFISTKDIENLRDEIKAREGNIDGITRFHRTARDLAESGVFRRLTDHEKECRGFDKRYATFEYKAGYTWNYVIQQWEYKGGYG